MPWETADEPSPATEDAAELVVAPGLVRLHPPSDGPAVWAAARRTTVPFVLVTGWTDRQSLDLGRLTHAVVDGVAEPTDVRAPAVDRTTADRLLPTGRAGGRP